MGKTAKGAVWLTPEHLSDYDYWQFWRNTQDADVGRFLRLFTELPLDEIKKLEALEGQELNEAKKVLANEATALCRGAGAAKKAAATAAKTFEEGEFAKDLPAYPVSISALGENTSNTSFLAASGAFPSKKEIRRRIEQGAIWINKIKVTDPNGRDYQEGENRVRSGKKTHFIINASK